jgi:hypothetical protein
MANIALAFFSSYFKRTGSVLKKNMSVPLELANDEKSGV